MAYGKGLQNVQRRSLPAGKTMLNQNVLPAGKLHDVLIIREKFLAAANAFVDTLFLPDPLKNTRTNEEIVSILTAAQKAMGKGFNKAYVEKARLAVPAAIAQIEGKYFNRLYGRLLHCATKTDEKDPAKRQYLNIPETIQKKVSLNDLTAIEQKIADLGYPQTIALFRQVIVKKVTAGLTRKEIAVIRAIHGECLAKYCKPVFGADARFACQINLDYRVIRSNLDPVIELDKGARLLVDRGNRKFHHFLEISNPVPRGETIKIPMVMSAKTLTRFDKLSSISSLAVVIEPDAVMVRTVITKPDREPVLDGITHLVARDFGMLNTVSLSIVALDDPIDPKRLARIARFTKEDALKHLENYSHPNHNIVKRVRFSGKNFLKNIADSCDKIDYLKSQIDTGYNRLEKLKGIICGYLGLDEQDRLTKGQLFDDPYIQHIHDKFFRLLQHVLNMKQLRLSLYKKIVGVKKSWFGFLTNQEAILAKEYHAAIVREDLTILTKEKSSSGYKGRTFNKMINNGSKGQYLRRASDKLRWDGIPELIIPSYYTSTACTVHSLVDPGMRQGELFCCPRCNVKEHADEHAADTIGNYLLLRPNPVQQVTLRLSKGQLSARNCLIGSPNQ